VVVKTGGAAIAGLTDDSVPSRLGPKRANKIRALFNLTKDDNVNVRKYVISHTFASKKGKEVWRAPKIQRLVTPLVLQRKRERTRKAAKLASVLRNKEDAAAYTKLVAQRLAEQKEARRSLISKRRSTSRSPKVEATAWVSTRGGHREIKYSE
jgi:small subunit ribosomal protein S6e